jgi:hypothetical protein
VDRCADGDHGRDDLQARAATGQAGPPPAPGTPASTSKVRRSRTADRVRRGRGIRQGHADRAGPGLSPLQGAGGPGHSGAGRNPVRRPSQGDHPRSDHRQGGRSGRGAGLRRLPGPPGEHGDPAGPVRGQGRALRPVRRLVRGLPGSRSRAGGAGHPDAERLGHPGAVPGPGDPAASGAGAGAGPLGRRS